MKNRNLILLAVGCVLIFVVLVGVIVLLLVNRKQSSVTTYSENICWNNVISNDSKYYWPNGCTGEKPFLGRICTQALVKLSDREVEEFELWLRDGSPEISGCTISDSMQLDSLADEKDIIQEFSMAEVEAANEIDNCLMVYNGSVFKIPASYPEEHPGGEELVVSSCGTDASEKFDSSHEGNTALLELIQFFVGILK